MSGRFYKVGRQLLNVASSQGGLTVGQMLFAVLTTRWLPPDSRGALLLLLSVANLLAATGNGGLGIEGRRRVSLGQEGISRLYRAAALVAAIVCVVMTVVLGYPLLYFTAAIMGWATWLLLPILTLSQASMFVMRSGLYARGLYARATPALVMGSALQVIGVVVLHVMDMLTYTTSALVWTAVSVVNALQLRWAFIATSPEESKPSVGEALTLYRASLRALPGVLSMRYQASGDKILLGLVSSPSTVAVYAVGRSLVALPQFLTMVVSQLTLTRAVGTNQKRFGRLERLSVIATAIICVACALAAPWVVPFVFGEAYTSAVSVTQIFMGAAFFLSLQTISRVIRQARGAHRQVAINGLVGVVSLTILVPLLGSLYGANGAAVAMLISSVLSASVWGLTARSDHKED